MHIAFTIFKFFPHGGSARDLAKIAARCLERAHRVRIYALEWEGPRLQGVETVVIPTRGLRSHVRQRRFADRVTAHAAAHPVDLVVGMNKMPGLDVYYAADSCFEDKARIQRPWIYRLTTRYRHYAEFERRVFAPDSRTRILTIAPGQDAAFRDVYRTPAYRFHSLPPGIERDRGGASLEAGHALRTEFDVAETDILVLFVGSGFVKKGLDRVLRGVAALPSAVRNRVRLVVVGDDKAGRFQRLARRLRIDARVRFVGGRDDVAAWLRAADALALPAYDEAAGMVILEAASAGVPVVATANCGYAAFLSEANAGIVTPVPFDQARFNADLERLLTADERELMARNGRELAASESLYAMAPRAVDVLETVAGGVEPSLVSFCALDYSTTDPRYRSLVPIARACRRRAMDVQVFVADWRGPMPDGIDVVAVPATAMGRNRRRARRREWVASRCVACRGSWWSSTPRAGSTFALVGDRGDREGVASLTDCRRASSRHPRRRESLVKPCVRSLASASTTSSLPWRRATSPRGDSSACSWRSESCRRRFALVAQCWQPVDRAFALALPSGNSGSTAGFGSTATGRRSMPSKRRTRSWISRTGGPRMAGYSTRLRPGGRW